jgi:DNA-binding MarR family transcriptional regulator
MPNPADRREKLITLTDEGADYARDRLSAIRAIESRAFEKMGPSQMALMSELLSRYSALLEEAVTEADPSGRA